MGIGSFPLSTHASMEFVDISGQLQEAVRISGVGNGLLVAYSPPPPLPGLRSTKEQTRLFKKICLEFLNKLSPKTTNINTERATPPPMP
jgi:thiamine phosphate synthase YjbQ (UPF0047 family)